jgi:hypothetical protein
VQKLKIAKKSKLRLKERKEKLQKLRKDIKT